MGCEMSTGQWVLVIAAALAIVFGLWRLATDGRFRGTRAIRAAAASTGAARSAGVTGDTGGMTPSDPAASDTAGQVAPPSVLAGTEWADALGERATLLQFSSAFCAPCRVTRRTLAEVAEIVPGVAHVEVDAELHLDLVRRVGVLRTPTTLVLDAAGAEVTRAAGAPTKQQVLAALASFD